METITIPTPTALLNSPVVQTPSVQRTKPKPAPKPRKSQAASSKPSKATVLTAPGATKPKQSKSRNGMYPNIAVTSLSTLVHLGLADAVFRVCDLQSEEVEVRRDQAYLSAMP